ncbi:radical SAM family heme chaperone HemW [Clostridium sp. AWRP]|uniref:radical SAM family heme chaperone HemW n=1 Tax=Clostridium sp. AWRP TaxID=2212991 RepID=UPI000FDCC86C|nr:radical SAM family heme chaperone HemW [Clostridium sp. AWRP]AZV55786.1 oxygen-independent coproporphyrinogen III oxidase [Clostridium sp. AWRP]
MQDKNVDVKKAVALYIHIPFCKKKCLYCDFPSYSGKEKLMVSYTKALAKDIESIGDRKIRTIFIGGGTPTYLSLESWNNIYEALKKINAEDNLEFTVEGNPGTFTEDKFKVLRKLGVNRLSIGLQAWQNSILKCIGRIHTLEDFLKTYDMARKFKFSNINIDLMFGLPGQTIEDWKESLQNVVKLNPEHISCYSLIVEKGTPFYNAHQLKNLNLPGEEQERQMYYFTLDFLSKIGYEQYEISNFSKKDRKCKHNLIYWNMEEYIGCGAGAHSYVDGYRYRNTPNIEEYILQGNLNQFLRLDKHKNSICDSMEEFVFMGLRKIDGISTEDFYRRFNKNIYSVYGDVIEKYIKMGILIKEGHMLYLSKRGIEVSNSVMCDFILT